MNRGYQGRYGGSYTNSKRFHPESMSILLDTWANLPVRARGSYKHFEKLYNDNTDPFQIDVMGRFSNLLISQKFSKGKQVRELSIQEQIEKRAQGKAWDKIKHSITLLSGQKRLKKLITLKSRAYMDQSLSKMSSKQKAANQVSVSRMLSRQQTIKCIQLMKEKEPWANIPENQTGKLTWIPFHLDLNISECGRIYISDWVGAQNKNSISKNEIDLIVTIGKDNRIKYFDQIENVIIPIEDSQIPKLNLNFPKLYSMLNTNLNNKKRILIHCGKGVSRSPACVAALLIRKYKMNLNQALRTINKYRNFIQVTEPLLYELKILELRFIKN